MKLELQKQDLHKAINRSDDALLVFMFSNDMEPQNQLGDWIQKAIECGDFKSSAGSTLQSYAMSGVRPRHLIVVHCGLGSRQDLRKAMEIAWQCLRQTGAKTLSIQWIGLPETQNPSCVLEQMVLALFNSSYVYTHTLSNGPKPALTKVCFGMPDLDISLRKALIRAVAIAQGIKLAKEWADRPANHATPTHLAQAAQALAHQPNIQCKVLGRKEIERLGMGAFIAVAQGTYEPLRFIILEYKGPKAKGAPTVLIGKGITFDTGGISIKPAAEMDEMKFDMSGAASVLGVFRALADLQPALHVVGLIPATENMPDGQAVKPGDVVTSMSGQTIEILNTDAEGRLVLCDALTYAKRYKPKAVIDIATLTGACVIALGAVRSGLFTSDDALADRLLKAGESAGDPVWRMPMDDEYADGLKSQFADVANVGGRAAGSVTAAKFLQRFAGDMPWAHLDIAGTAWRSGAAKGATGRPVGMLMHFLLEETSSIKTSGSR